MDEDNLQELSLKKGCKGDEAMKYLKVWVDFKEVIAILTDAEKGRLFDAMLDYAGTGQEPSDFAGNECFLWGVAKRDIDNAAKESEKRSINGSKGGRGNKATESNEKQNKANESNTKQIEANESRKEKKGKEKKRNEKKYSFFDDAEAFEILQEQNDVLDAAERAGFDHSPGVTERLIALYASNGKDKMLSAIDACMTHGAANLAYLEAVLSGKPKESKTSKKVLAQEYEQRDYTDVQKQIEDEQRRRFEARLRGDSA